MNIWNGAHVQAGLQEDMGEKSHVIWKRELKLPGQIQG